MHELNLEFFESILVASAAVVMMTTMTSAVHSAADVYVTRRLLEVLCGVLFGACLCQLAEYELLDRFIHVRLVVAIDHVVDALVVCFRAVY